MKNLKMARPYKDNTGRWRGWIIDPMTGKRRTVTGKTRAACSERLTRLEEQLSTNVRPDGRSVGDWLTDTVNSAQRDGSLPRPSTVDHRAYLKSLVPAWLANMPIELVTVMDVQRALDEIRDAPTNQGKARNRDTVGRVRSFLVTTFRRAQKFDAISRNVAAETDTISEGELNPRYLVIDEARRVLDELKEHPWYAMYLLLVTVGLRRSEVLGMRWDRLDLDEGTLRVQWTLVKTKNGVLLLDKTKTTGSQRTVSLPPTVVDALRTHRATYGQISEWVWTQPAPLQVPRGANRETPHGLPHPDSLRGPLRPACIRAGVQPVTPHDLRHTAATIALAAGEDSRIVMDLLGHEDPRMMARYQHVVDASRKRTAAKIDKLWQDPT